MTWLEGLQTWGQGTLELTSTFGNLVSPVLPVFGQASDLMEFKVENMKESSFWDQLGALMPGDKDGPATEVVYGTTNPGPFTPFSPSNLLGESGSNPGSLKGYLLAGGVGFGLAIFGVLALFIVLK